MTPVSTASLMPLSTAGTYSRGTLPPTTPLINSYPLPCSLGSNFSHTCPYCPRPPDWRMNLPSLSTLPRMVESEGKLDRKSTRLNSSHTVISYAVFCLKKKKNKTQERQIPNRYVNTITTQQLRT